MNKTELISNIAEKTNTTKKATAAIVDEMFAVIANTIAEGDKVTLIGFGTFEARERAARTGKNPQTGETVEIPACKAPAFKAGKALKDAVNK